MQSVSRAANSRCSYARRLLELAPPCASHLRRLLLRRGGEQKAFCTKVLQLDERHWATLDKIAGGDHKDHPFGYSCPPLRLSPLLTASSPNILCGLFVRSCVCWNPVASFQKETKYLSPASDSLPTACSPPTVDQFSLLECCRTYIIAAQ